MLRPHAAERAALLASCAANPPASRWAPVYQLADGQAIHGNRYSRRDDRVRRLMAIREADMAATLAHGDATGDYGPFGAACVSVGEAIDAAIAAGVREAA